MPLPTIGAIGFDTPSQQADIKNRSSAAFLRTKSALHPTIVGCSGGVERLAGFLIDRSINPARSRRLV